MSTWFMGKISRLILPRPRLTMTDATHNTPKSLNASYAAAEMINQRRVTIEALKIKPGDKALDIGCGTGFLTLEVARKTGGTGQVCAIDIEQPMVDATLERCAEFDHVSAAIGDVSKLDFSDNTFDLVTCTQVLLYVKDVPQALAEMARVIRPSGQIAVLDTDWRGVVLHSSYPELSDRIYRAWDQVVASPNLPTRLGPLLESAGFSNIAVTPIPLLNTTFDPGNFSVGSLDWMTGNAYKQGAITKQESQLWRDDLAKLGKKGQYFFCVNRFLFVGKK